MQSKQGFPLHLPNACLGSSRSLPGSQRQRALLQAQHRAELGLSSHPWYWVAMGDWNMGHVMAECMAFISHGGKVIDHLVEPNWQVESHLGHGSPASQHSNYQSPWGLLLNLSVHKTGTVPGSGSHVQSHTAQGCRHHNATCKIHLGCWSYIAPSGHLSKCTSKAWEASKPAWSSVAESRKALRHSIAASLCSTEADVHGRTPEFVCHRLVAIQSASPKEHLNFAWWHRLHLPESSVGRWPQQDLFPAKRFGALTRPTDLLAHQVDELIVASQTKGPKWPAPGKKQQKKPVQIVIRTRLICRKTRCETNLGSFCQGRVLQTQSANQKAVSWTNTYQGAWAHTVTAATWLARRALTYLTTSEDCA